MDISSLTRGRNVDGRINRPSEENRNLFRSLPQRMGAGTGTLAAELTEYEIDSVRLPRGDLYKGDRLQIDA